jgi:hypothetical protein
MKFYIVNVYHVFNVSFLPPTLGIFRKYLGRTAYKRSPGRGRRFYILLEIVSEKKVRAEIGTETLLEEIMCRDGGYPCCI